VTMLSADNQVEWWNVSTVGSEIQNLSDVISSGFLNEGPVTLELEEYFKMFFGVKYAILTTSGTIALYLGLKAIGIGPGDKVGVPNLTFIATANAVALTGAEVVLIDVHANTLCIDEEALIKVHKFVGLRAVVPVHVSGRSALTPELCAALKEFDIAIVEDAAEAFASKDPIQKCYLGTIGSAGAFSFSPNKIVTSGQGGLVVTNSDEVAGRIRELKDQGRPTRGTGGDDLHISLGFNFKYTDLQAAVLKAQLEQLTVRMKHLSSIYDFYSKCFNPNVRLLNFQTQEGEFPLWPEIQVENRQEFEAHLQNSGVGFRRIWHPLSTQKPYQAQNGQFAISEEISMKTLWLPSAFSLNQKKLERVVLAINSFRWDI
jgi:perosamine synthetase